MPNAANVQSRTGRPPAAEVASRRTATGSRVGTTATSHSTASILVADVDHGSDNATAAASPSARRARRAPKSAFATMGSRPPSDIAIILAAGDPVVFHDRPVGLPRLRPQYRQA